MRLDAIVSQRQAALAQHVHTFLQLAAAAVLTVAVMCWKHAVTQPQLLQHMVLCLACLAENRSASDTSQHPRMQHTCWINAAKSHLLRLLLSNCTCHSSCRPCR